jgi:hypothetical protein
MEPPRRSFPHLALDLPSGRSRIARKSDDLDAHAPGVSDGTRTRDVLDHNQVLYQLSYTHHASGPSMFLDHTAQREVYRAGVGGRNQFWLGTTPVSEPRMRSAISFDVVLSGPGSGTNTASR